MTLPLSVAHLAGLSAFQLALVLFFVEPKLAAIPLALFVLLCLIAPFLATFPFFLPIVSHGNRRKNRVALSFDDGPDPEVTPRLLDLLDRHGIRAAFFLVGTKVEANPELVRQILARGHDIGNHSWHHFPFLMLKGPRLLRQEVERAQTIFQGFGITPRAFRPPVGITSSWLWRVLLDNGMFCLNFSCRAWDAGNRRIEHLATRLLKKVRPGDLILLHDVVPSRASVDQLFSEFEQLLQGLKDKGLEIVPPAALIERTIMERDGNTKGAAASFYDDLAERYDEEQFNSGVSRSRKLELALFRARLPKLVRKDGRVLEIGAGTGIFTLEMAPLCQEVHALDISANMIRLLEHKAKNAGITNVRTSVSDAQSAKFQGPYSLVCAFSALEYIQDLPGLFQRLAPHMESGAKVYLITARTSVPRFFIQIGNALRQGIWLKSRSSHEMKALLRAAGVQEIRTEGHLLKGFLSGGMLLETEGRWPVEKPKG